MIIVKSINSNHKISKTLNVRYGNNTEKCLKIMKLLIPAIKVQILLMHVTEIIPLASLAQADCPTRH